MKQITHDYNYLAYYDVKKSKNLFTLYNKNRLSNFDTKKGDIIVESVVKFNKRTNNQFISVEEMTKFNEFVNLLSTSIYWACDSAGWYWDKQKLNNFASEDENAIIVVSAKVNNPSASDNPSGKGINELKDRKLYFEYLKQIFDYENCK
jgi:predicted chitinase